MEVYIQDVIATVRAVSTDSVLAPKTLEKIVSTVLGAVRAEQEHKDRLKSERSLIGSGRHEGEA
jgi:hypothetical protein